MKKNGETPESLPFKVVVIDEEEKEAAALIRALSKKNISVLYYLGRKEEFPEEPLTGIRIIFLDMILEGMNGLDSKELISAHIGLLKNLISPDNGPFLIFAWTNHPEHLEELQIQLDQSGAELPKPFHIVNMEKHECKTGDEYDYNIISQKLDEKLSELSIFNLFMKWENLVDKSKTDTISLINSLVNISDPDKWKEEMEKILYQMAIAYSGRSSIENGLASPSKSSMKVMNRMLTDSIESQVDRISEELYEIPGKPGIPPDIRSVLNTKINLRDISSFDAKTSPGNLYIFEEFKEIQPFIPFLPDNPRTVHRHFLSVESEYPDGHEIPEHLEQCKSCLLEITPICDYAQGKWKSSRVLTGLLVPTELIPQKKEKAAFLFTTPIFWVGDRKMFIIFSAHYQVALPFDVIGGLSPKYQLRLDLLSDIQHKFSNHISRLGTIYLD